MEPDATFVAVSAFTGDEGKRVGQPFRAGMSLREPDQCRIVGVSYFFDSVSIDCDG